jgi:cardiolipin synthase
VRRHLPNAITALRLFALPFAAWALLRGDRPLTLSLVAFIAASDWLDGFLARRWNVQSPVGRVLDPIADKLTQLTLLALLAFGGRAEFGAIPGWFAGLVFARELFLVYGTLRIRLHKGDVRIEPRLEGKLSTALVFAILLLALFDVPERWLRVLAYATMPVVIASAIRYYRDGIAQVR